MRALGFVGLDIGRRGATLAHHNRRCPNGASPGLGGGDREACSLVAAMASQAFDVAKARNLPRLVSLMFDMGEERSHHQWRTGFALSPKGNRQASSWRNSK